MTTKQRAYLKSLAMKIEPIFQIGKSSMSPGLTEAVSEALEARELIKISVQIQVHTYVMLGVLIASRRIYYQLWQSTLR